MALSPHSERLVDPLPGDPVSAEQARLQNEMLRKHTVLIDSTSDSGGVRAVSRRVSAPDELYWCMLMEDHPGISVPDDVKCFDIIVAEYCQYSRAHLFDCDTDPDDYEVGVDYHYGAPTPGAVTCGWFKRLPDPYSKSGWIYHVVSLFCTANPPCSNYGLTNGECPDQSTDPCGA